MHKGKKIKYYSLTSLKIITIGAMKLNVQTPSCMAQNCIMVRTKPLIYTQQWNISYNPIITCK